MVVHSLKSTSTPKNSHYFIDPIGLSSFTLLDKLSDIYSIGKIVDYITGKSDLNKKLSYVITKATNRDRNKRYNNIDEIIKDIENLTKEISEAERHRRVEQKIERGENSPDVETFITNLIRQNQLSNYIVSKQLYGFGKLLLEFAEPDQLSALEEMNQNYSAATGYGHFENYDVFATLANYVIRNSTNRNIQESAYYLLDGCVKYRYSAENYLREINIYYPMLGN